MCNVGNCHRSNSTTYFVTWAALGCFCGNDGRKCGTRLAGRGRGIAPLVVHPPAREALLFPTPKNPERPLKDIRKMLDGIVDSTGIWKAGEIHPYIFRHTYCAARLQTLDGGAPVSAYTVGKEMGHGGDALVRRVYGHLGTVRHRAEAVEFRVEQHPITLRKHISRLQWGRLPFERQPKVEQQNRRIA